MCCAHTFIAFYICVKFHENIANFFFFNLPSGHQCIIEMAMFNVQRKITPKVAKSELRFMCSAGCFIRPVHLCEVWWKYLGRYQSY